jgi:hypothetical protein
MRKYTGPAKPIPTYREPITHKVDRVLFAVGGCGWCV